MLNTILRPPVTHWLRWAIGRFAAHSPRPCQPLFSSLVLVSAFLTDCPRPCQPLFCLSSVPVSSFCLLSSLSALFDRLSSSLSALFCLSSSLSDLVDRLSSSLSDLFCLSSSLSDLFCLSSSLSSLFDSPRPCQPFICLPSSMSAPAFDWFSPSLSVSCFCLSFVLVSPFCLSASLSALLTDCSRPCQPFCLSSSLSVLFNSPYPCQFFLSFLVRVISFCLSSSLSALMTDSPRSFLSSFFGVSARPCEPFLSLFVFVFLRLCQLFLSLLVLVGFFCLSSSLSALFGRLSSSLSALFGRLSSSLSALFDRLSLSMSSPFVSPRPCQLFVSFDRLSSSLSAQIFDRLSASSFSALNLSLLVLVRSFWPTLLDLVILFVPPRRCQLFSDSPRPCQLFLSPLVSPCTQLFLSLLVLVSPFCLSLSLAALLVSPRPCQPFLSLRPASSLPVLFIVLVSSLNLGKVIDSPHANANTWNWQGDIPPPPEVIL